MNGDHCISRHPHAHFERGHDKHQREAFYFSIHKRFKLHSVQLYLFVILWYVLIQHSVFERGAYAKQSFGLYQ